MSTHAQRKANKRAKAKRDERVIELLVQDERITLIEAQTGVPVRTIYRLRKANQARIERAKSRMQQKWQKEAALEAASQLISDSGNGMTQGTEVARPERLEAALRPDLHPCGRPVEIAKRTTKKQTRGEAKPCTCDLCALSVDGRMRNWTHWKSERYCGTYECHKCERITFCAGDNQDELWCRECYGLPHVVTSKKDDDDERGS